MSDLAIRTGTKGLPMPSFEDPAFQTPPPLSAATVAVVTTAGLQKTGDEIWDAGSEAFRVFDKDDRDLTCSHLSNNWDRSGLVADLNIAYPLDRLEELAAEGVIGAVAPRHLSFMGALQSLSVIREDSGLAAAKLLRDDGVDVVLLTPV